MAQAEAVVRLLRALVEHYADRPNLLPDPGHRVAAGSSAALRAAVTYVGGMTDRYACQQAVALLGWDPAELPAGVDTGSCVGSAASAVRVGTPSDQARQIAKTAILPHCLVGRPAGTDSAVGATVRHSQPGRAEAQLVLAAASASRGWTSTTLRPLRSPNFTVPSTRANSVSSPPRPTFSPGWKRVPRWRTMIDAGRDGRAVEHLHAEALRVGVAAVAGGAAALGLRHVRLSPCAILVISTVV